jgi:hypothetical protein
MDIVIKAEISPDRRLTGYELPPDVPVGQVELVIRPAEEGGGTRPRLTREAARARLLAAGRLSTARHSPENPIRLSDEEHQRLARLFGGDDLTMLDLVNEDRGLKE